MLALYSLFIKIIYRQFSPFVNFKVEYIHSIVIIGCFNLKIDLCATASVRIFCVSIRKVTKTSISALTHSSAKQ